MLLRTLLEPRLVSYTECLNGNFQNNKCRILLQYLKPAIVWEPSCCFVSLLPHLVVLEKVTAQARNFFPKQAKNHHVGHRKSPFNCMVFKSTFF